MTAAAPTDRRMLRYVCVALAASMWGTWPLFLDAAEKRGKMPPALVSTIVMAVLAIVSAITMTRDRVAARAPRRAWLGVLWLGIGDAMNVLLFFSAYRETTVAVAVLTHYLTPIFVAIAAPFVLREKATLRTVLAVGIAFAGLAILLWPSLGARGAGSAVLGAVFGAGSAVFYASNVIVNKRLTSSFSTSELMFFHCLVACPLLALFVPRAAWGAMEPGAVAIIVAGAIGPGAIAGLAFVWGLRGIPASHASTLTLLEPLVAVVVGWAVLGQTLGIEGAIGGATILGGAALVVTARPASRHPSQIDAKLINPGS